MKKTIISFIFLSLGTGLIAQNYTLQSAWDFYRLHKKNDNALNTALTENDIQGSPYAEKDFQDGYVVTTSDSKFVDLKLRYNIFNDRIEYMDESGAPLAFSYPDVINHVVIGNDKYVYSPYAVQKKIEKGFFRVVEEGKSALYVRKKIFFQEAVPPGAYKDAEPPKFLNKPDEYYIRIEPAEAKKVGNKNELATLFPDKQAELEEFIKKNKVKTNNKDDLAALVKFYNSLK